MTVRRNDNGVLVLEGTCPVVDVEGLLVVLKVKPTAVLDWAQCHQVHTAVFQVILASGRPAVGSCGWSWWAQWLAPKLAQMGTNG